MKNFIQWLIRLFSKKAKELYNKPLVDVDKARNEAVKQIENADANVDKKLSIKEIKDACAKIVKDLIAKAKETINKQKK